MSYTFTRKGYNTWRPDVPVDAVELRLEYDGYIDLGHLTLPLLRKLDMTQAILLGATKFFRRHKVKEYRCTAACRDAAHIGPSYDALKKRHWYLTDKELCSRKFNPRIRKQPKQFDPSHVDIMHLQGDICEPELDSSISSVRISASHCCSLKLTANGLRRLELKGPIVLCDAEDFFERNVNLEYFRGIVCRTSFENIHDFIYGCKRSGYFRMPPNQITGGTIRFTAELIDAREVVIDLHDERPHYVYLRTDAEYVRGVKVGDPWEALGIANPWVVRAKSALFLCKKKVN